MSDIKSSPDHGHDNHDALSADELANATGGKGKAAPVGVPTSVPGSHGNLQKMRAGDGVTLIGNTGSFGDNVGEQLPDDWG
jgi:hypothetical protein